MCRGLRHILQKCFTEVARYAVTGLYKNYVRFYPEDRMFNPLLRRVVKWSDGQQMISKCCKIFKICLTILRH